MYLNYKHKKVSPVKIPENIEKHIYKKTLINPIDKKIKFQVDDIEAQINLFNLGRRTPTPTEVEMRKFRNLKILVLWLQKEQKFGRYCYYGCHCLPEGSHNIAQGGYGKPKDNIDASCRRFGQCYKCLKDEHKNDKGWPAQQPGCIGEEIGYSADLLVDNTTGRKYIQCNNYL